MRPGRQNEALVIIGQLDHWWLPRHGASIPAAATGVIAQRGSILGASTPGAATGASMEHYGRHDAISAADAWRYFDLRWHCHVAGGGLADNFRVDLLAEAEQPHGWQWNRFLMGRPWGEQLFREEVINLVLLINTEEDHPRPCLSIKTRANEQLGFRLITWNGAKCSLVT